MHVASLSPVGATLKKVADHLRGRLDIPVLVRWKGGEGIKLGDFETPTVMVDVLDAQGAAALAAPDLDSLGSAYVEGHIDVSGSVQDVVAVAHQLAAAGDADATSDKPGLVERVARHIATSKSHSRDQDRKDIQYHYDVSNAFYQEWLDPRMLYSCAYFENGDETLEEAQVKKLDHILTKVRVQPGQRLLDIGCGWGGLVIRAAEKFGATCVGVTLSQNQFDEATRRVQAAGLQGKVEIRLQDYRDIPASDQFDRITSVGMCEHVGLKNMETYFKVVHDHLKPDGWMLNHNITTTDADNGETSYNAGDFIDKYVFPDGELPHISTILSCMQRAGLEAIDVEGLRDHYARTLRCWSDAFEAKTDKLKAMVEPKTWRVWRMYLVGCQWAFENDECSVFQTLCHRAGQRSNTLPRSRRWMYSGRP